MITRKHRTSKRSGAAALETALVMIPMVMLLFGVFEYGRLLMDWNLLNNAAREGCRYALVHNTDSTIATDVKNVVLAKMSGRDTASFASFSVSMSGKHLGVSTPINNLVPGDMITVSVSGQYKFLNIIPFVTMPTLTINSSVVMVCEGGT
jgi:Flp pilus assembly protein TadG